MKKFFTSLVILFLGIGLGILIWGVFFDGDEFIESRRVFPTQPQENYQGYYYNSLEKDEKIAYELIMAEIGNFPKKIRIPVIDDEGLSDVFDALHYDNADFFFLGENCNIETTSFGTCYFVPKYVMSYTRYESAMEELGKIKQEVLAATANLSDDFDKELYIHDLIVENCSYVEEIGGEYSSSYGCLVNGKASCEGYAKAMKYLLDAVDIENYMIYGVTETDSEDDDGHAWNVAKINSDYYHVDATWDDPVDAESGNKYSYFNLTDEEISKTHTADKRFEKVCKETAENYYVKNGIVFDEYNAETVNSLTSEFAKQMRLGEDTVSFKMTNKEALREAEKELFDMNGIYGVMLMASTVSGKSMDSDEIMYAIDDTHMIVIITDY